jgi:hypothetical protein
MSHTRRLLSQVTDCGYLDLTYQHQRFPLRHDRRGSRDPARVQTPAKVGLQNLVSLHWVTKVVDFVFKPLSQSSHLCRWVTKKTLTNFVDKLCRQTLVSHHDFNVFLKGLLPTGMSSLLSDSLFNVFILKLGDKSLWKEINPDLNG